MLIRNANLAKAGKYFDSNGSLNLVAGSNITVEDDLNGNLTISSTASGTIDSDAVFSLIDSNYVQARQTPQDFAYSSLTGAPIFADSAYVGSTVTAAINGLVDAAPGSLDTLNELAAALGDDANFSTTITNSIATKLAISDFGTKFDSALALKTTDDVTEGSNLYYTDARVEGVVDTAYIQARQLTDYLDSALAIQLIDSAYVQARQTTYDFLDSAEAIALVDSAYVQARQTPQDFAYASLTGAPNVLDSTNISSIITADVDQTFVRNLQDYDYGSLENTPNVLDSTNVSNIITDDVDAAYVQARQDYAYGSLTGTPNVLDSVNVSNIITDDVDSAYVQLRQDYAYSNLTGTPDISSIITADVDKAFVDALGVDAATLDGQNPSYYNDFDNLTNVPQAIDSTANVTFATATVDHIDFTSGSAPAWAEGRVFYDNVNKALATYVDESEVTLQIGQEEWIRVYNNTGSTILNATPVTISGDYLGTPLVTVANSLSYDAAAIEGVATHDISTGGYGYVTSRGVVRDINTSNLIAGQDVFLGQDSGSLSATSPAYPYWTNKIGVCLISDSTGGSIYVHPEQSTFNTLRVQSNARVDGNMTVAGDLTVLGNQSSVGLTNLSVENSFIYLNTGDTIGDSATNFTGSGLDDATFKNHYEGTTTKSFYVRIDGTGTPDTFEWSYDSDFASTEATDVAITGSLQTLSDNISILFGATTGHTLNDVWSGTASPVNVDVGWAANRNTGTSGVGYTHLGIFFDITDEKFKAFKSYGPEPEGDINTADSSYEGGTLVADIEGDVTGTASNATNLDGQIPAYYLNYANFTNTPNVLDSTNVSNIIIADVDKTFVEALNLDYANITNTPNVLDSGHVSAIITADVDAAFINALTIDADTLGSQAGSYYLDYTNFTNTPNILDSADVQALVTAGSADSATITALVDSDYVQARQTPQDFAYSSLTGLPDFVDSSDVSLIVTNDVDKAFVDALNVNADTLDGEQGSHYLDYTNFTNTPNVLDSTNVTDIVNGLTIDADTLEGQAGSYYLDYNNLTNVPAAPTGIDSDATIALIDSDYVQARQLAQDFAYASLTGKPTILDSTNVSSIVTAAIDGLVDAAPGSLDTLNELAAALGDDANFSTTVTNSIATKLAISAFDTKFDSAFAGKTTTELSEGTNLYHTQARVEGIIDTAYIQARQDYAYSSLTGVPAIPTAAFTKVSISGEVDILADSVADTLTFTAGPGISLSTDAGGDEVVFTISSTGLDSNATIAVINEVVDSAFVQLRQSFVGEVGIDSAGAVAITRTLIDSAITANTGITLSTFTGDASTTSFTTNYEGNVGANDIIVALDGIIQRPTTDYVITSGNVEFTSAPDSDVTISTRLVAGAGNNNWIVVTGGSAASGNKLFVDCSSSAVSVQLPGTPSIGDEVYIVDAENNAATNNITINRNGQRIDGVEEDLVVDVDGAAFILAYYNVTRGWIFISK